MKRMSEQVPGTGDGWECPLCGVPGTACFQVEGVSIRECGVCRHRYAALVTQPDHVQRHYNDAYFFAGQAGYSDYLASEDLLRKQGRWYARLMMKHAQDRSPRPGNIETASHRRPSLFAVGAAAGFDSDEFRKAGWSVVGIEPNETMARYAREQTGLDIKTASLESLGDGPIFDVVTAIQVMGHFTDPLTAAHRLATLVSPGGYLLVETWDYRSWVASMFGRYWHEYSPPTVLQWFSRQSLASLMQRFAMDVVVSGKPDKRIGGAHARSLLEYKLAQMPLPRVTQAMLRAIPKNLTLRYPGDDLFWMLFRKR